jgi:SAM-dependent methyltransferase
METNPISSMAHWLIIAGLGHCASQCAPRPYNWNVKPASRTPRDCRNEARQYAQRGMRGTDWVAFREVARRRYLANAQVLDLGCGPGRSTAFLRDMGNRVVAVDVSHPMLEQARRLDPHGSYLQIGDARLPLADAVFDGFFSSWVLLEIGQRDRIIALLRECARVVRPGGTGVIIANTAEFYGGDWVSSDVDFPENAGPLTSGQAVRARLLPQGVEVRDYFWSDSDYKAFFAGTGMTLREKLRPLGEPGDGVTWKDETRLPPHVVYVLTTR